MNVGKSRKFNNVRKKWCSCHNSNGHSNEECYQQTNGRKCEDSSTADGKKSKKHNISSLTAIISFAAVTVKSKRKL